MAGKTVEVSEKFELKKGTDGKIKIYFPPPSGSFMVATDMNGKPLKDKKGKDILLEFDPKNDTIALTKDFKQEKISTIIEGGAAQNINLINNTGNPIIVNGSFNAISGHFLRETTLTNLTRLNRLDNKIGANYPKITEDKKTGIKTVTHPVGIAADKTPIFTSYKVSKDARVDEVAIGTKIANFKKGFLTVSGEETLETANKRIARLQNQTMENLKDALAPLKNKQTIPATNEYKAEVNERALMLRDNLGWPPTGTPFGNYQTTPNKNADKDIEPAIPFKPNNRNGMAPTLPNLGSLVAANVENISASDLFTAEIRRPHTPASALPPKTPTLEA